MTTEFVDLKETMTVEDALKRIRRTGPDKETINVSYVIDDERRLIGLLSLYPDALDLLDMVSHFRHIQNENDIAFDYPEPIRNLLHMALVKPLPQKKFILHIFPECNFREIRYLIDGPADHTAAQSRKDSRGRRIVVHNPSLLIQRNHTVAHAV